MTNIIDLDSRRPHLTNPCRCKHCGYRWQAVYPVTTTTLECVCGVESDVSELVENPIWDERAKKVLSIIIMLGAAETAGMPISPEAQSFLDLVDSFMADDV